MSSSDGASDGRWIASHATARPQVATRTPRPDAELDGSELDTFIQATHTVTLKVDRDVLISDGAERTDDVIAGGGLEGAGDFLGAELQARECVVMPDAADAEPEIAQHVFGALD